MMKKRNKGKRAITAVGVVVAAGLTPGFIAATPGCMPVQGPDAEITEDKEIIIYSYVEQMPQFPGGEKALMKYFQSHINYPPMAADNKVQGCVVVRFIVDETGKVSDATVIHSVDYYLDREVVRVCKSLPKFIPARHNGQSVSVWYTLPVTFRFEGVNKTTAADTVAIDGKAYSFDELYAKQHPDSVNLDGSLPEVIIKAYPRVSKYGAHMPHPRSLDYEVLKGDTVYHRDVEMPRFPGGEAALEEYIQTHIQYPVNALKNHVQGIVLVNCLVDKTSKISATKVILSVNDDLDKEAVRIAKSLSYYFYPGRKNGKAVSTWYTLQVKFTLPKENDD
jgi:TonB family protein